MRLGKGVEMALYLSSEIQFVSSWQQKEEDGWTEQVGKKILREGKSQGTSQVNITLGEKKARTEISTGNKRRSCESTPRVSWCFQISKQRFSLHALPYNICKEWPWEKSISTRQLPYEWAHTSAASMLP